MSTLTIDVNNLDLYKPEHEHDYKTHIDSLVDLHDAMLHPHKIHKPSVAIKHDLTLFNHVCYTRTQSQVGLTEEQNVFFIVDTYYFEVVGGRVFYHLITGPEIDITDDPTSARTFVKLSDPECPSEFYFGKEFVYIIKNIATDLLRIHNER